MIENVNIEQYSDTQIKEPGEIHAPSIFSIPGRIYSNIQGLIKGNIDRTRAISDFVIMPIESAAFAANLMNTVNTVISFISTMAPAIQISAVFIMHTGKINAIVGILFMIFSILIEAIHITKLKLFAKGKIFNPAEKIKISDLKESFQDKKYSKYLEKLNQITNKKSYTNDQDEIFISLLDFYKTHLSNIQSYVKLEDRIRPFAAKRVKEKITKYLNILSTENKIFENKKIEKLIKLKKMIKIQSQKVVSVHIFNVAARAIVIIGLLLSFITITIGDKNLSNFMKYLPIGICILGSSMEVIKSIISPGLLETEGGLKDEEGVYIVQKKEFYTNIYKDIEKKIIKLYHDIIKFYLFIRYCIEKLEDLYNDLINYLVQKLDKALNPKHSTIVNSLEELKKV